MTCHVREPFASRGSAASVRVQHARPLVAHSLIRLGFFRAYGFSSPPPAIWAPAPPLACGFRRSHLAILRPSRRCHSLLAGQANSAGDRSCPYEPGLLGTHWLGHRKGPATGAAMPPSMISRHLDVCPTSKVLRRHGKVHTYKCALPPYYTASGPTWLAVKVTYQPFSPTLSVGSFVRDAGSRVPGGFSS
jgi:hypothetical protein